MTTWPAFVLRSLAFTLLAVPVCADDEAINADQAAGIVRISDQVETDPLIAVKETPAPLLPPTPDPVSSTDEAPPLFLKDDPSPPTYNGGVALHADRVPYLSSIEEEEAPWFAHTVEHFLEALTAPNVPLSKLIEFVTYEEHDSPESALDYCPIGIQPIPCRPELFVETNERFLAPGYLEQGITLPTGAVWRPAVWVFGTYRVGASHMDNPNGNDLEEIATRLDLFGQLNLSGTERVLFGLRPYDKERGASRRFTGYDFNDGSTIDGLNLDVQTLFFEGDFGEIFPNLDPYDTGTLDIGFSAGRQPMSFQQGLLINEDRIDAVTATRNTVSGMGNLNLRMTGVYAWNEIHRNNNQHDRNAQVVGLFTESDFRRSTVNADVVYVHSDSSFGSMWALALSSIQRFHGHENTYNTSFHVLASIPTDAETKASGRGVLLFGQTSWTPHHTHDLVYLNGFWAIDQFTSPVRGTLAGGPLGQTGILFSAAGLGRFGAPLNNQASEVAGGSLGYQLFFNHTKQQVIFEVGGREPTNGADGAFGFGTRFQKALNQHWIVVLDGFASKQESQRWIPGTRIEFLAKF